MSRPDVEAILAPLKPFQKRTVERAFHRLFQATDSTSRFLVADEVGLGKTLVARGIIARAIDHLWDSVKQIDIVYICSNSSIARSNLPKLRVEATGDQSYELSTRLTLLATQLAPKTGEKSLSDNKINLVSFTPGTSFNMGQASGRADERVVLFNLLEPLVDQRTALMNFLQAGVVDSDRWRNRLNDNEMAIEPGIRRYFEEAFSQRRELRRELEDVFDRWFFRRRDSWPWEARGRRNQLVGQLRNLLAEICVDALQADLVILDEFQRFKGLLETREEYRDPAAELAQTLFSARTPEGHPVRTLLLSATPYKLYTTDAEIEQEDHYEDFVATTRFLMDDDEVRVDSLKKGLSRYATALKRAAGGQADHIVEAKTSIERMLQSVMSRTERVGASEERDAMLEEPPIAMQIEVDDVRQYLAADALFRAVGDRDPIAFWKSAPYLANFMKGYKFNERLDETIRVSPEKVARLLHDHSAAFLNAQSIRRWSRMDLNNAKLRDVSSHALDGGLWQLLWMPPTVPYWPLGGPFEGQSGRTKSLVFSAWNVVPDAVSAVLSYEAERRMMGGQMSSYVDPGNQQGPLLRLSQSASGVLSRHRLLLLLLPCLPLADMAHPLSAPPGHDRRTWVRCQVTALLEDPKLPNPMDGEVDSRWEWIAPVLLDPGLGDFLRHWRKAEDIPRPNPEIFGDYINELRTFDPSDLGRRPDGLVDLLTEVALGSPAILAARTMAVAGLDSRDRRALSVRIADAFWRLFNRPAVVKLLGQLAPSEAQATREEGYYWRLVLRYCQDGNLQSVLDEAWHLTWEQNAWSEKESPDAIAEKSARQLVRRSRSTPPVSPASSFSLADPESRDPIPLLA